MSLMFMLLLQRIMGWSKFDTEVRKILADRKILLSVVAAGIVVTLNWMIYIVAVNQGRIVETALGYYINPLVSILFGIYYFKERLTIWTKISFALAIIGVMIMIIRLGQFPWLPLALALSFGMYGLIKKTLRVSVFTGLTLETLVVAPFCAAYIYYRHVHGVSAFESGSSTVGVLIALSGMITAVPLLLFSAGARLLPLNIVGFLQYLSPTLSLLIGVFVYGELFTLVHLFTFSFIWPALELFTISQTKFFNEYLLKVFAR